MVRLHVTFAALAAAALGFLLPGAALAQNCIYRANPPTLADQQTYNVQCDSAGNIKTTITGGIGSVNTGIVSSVPPSWLDGSAHPLSLDLAGNTRVNVVAGGIPGVSAGDTAGAGGVLPVQLPAPTSTMPVSNSNSITNPVSTLTRPTDTVSATITTPIASPGLVNWTSHGLVVGSAVQFSVSGGSLPTGLSTATTYYVIAAGLTANVFEVATTPGGSAINFTGSTTGTQTGTHFYAPGMLAASSATAGSIVVPSFAIANTAGGAIMPVLRLWTSATTGWAQPVTVNFYAVAPTFTNGDGLPWAVATGSQNWIGSTTITLVQMADGAVGNAPPNAISAIIHKLGAGTAIYWDVVPGASVPMVSAQQFKMTPELVN